MEADNGLRLRDVSIGSSPSPATTPSTNTGASLSFPNGFISFTLDQLAVGGSTTVTLHLPAGRSATNYFKFGKLPNAIDSFFFTFSDHWYAFDFDGQTGAEFLGDRILLHFVDGGCTRGPASARPRLAAEWILLLAAVMLLRGLSRAGGRPTCPGGIRRRQGITRTSMEPISLWEKLLLGVLVVLVLLWFRPGLKSAFRDRRKATTQEWMGVLIPIALVAVFVIFLIIMMRR